LVDPDDSLQIATVGNCFPLGSTARAWFDDFEDDLESYEQFESDFREAFIAGEESIVKLLQQWESCKQTQHSVRDFYTYLLTLRMRIASLDAGEKPTDREFLRKFCGNIREPVRTIISKKRITEPNLTLTQLVKLAELEERAVKDTSAALRAFGFGQWEKKKKGTQPEKGKKGNEQGGSKSKYCGYCRSNSHSWDECRKIAARKAAGNWEQRAPKERS
jgi:hypothetical protein